ncbi:MAG: hypothetical protein E6167_09080, partial [Varibaculum cambriense]|nr:hypothetical protein [Varibaculum cambriense]
MGDQYREFVNENSLGYSEETAATVADRQHSLTVADAVSAPAGRAEESTWRRVHWLTPLLQVWQALVIIVVVVLTQSLNNVIM